MGEDQQGTSSSVDQNEDKGSAPEEVVSVKAYKEMSNDMHKYKAMKKKLEMDNAELKTRIDTGEKAKLEEQNRFEELYRKSEDEKRKLLDERSQEKRLFVDAVKKSALKTELGGTIRDEYLNLATYDEIEVNDDGSLNSESVRNVANRFKQDHPALVPSGASGSITSQASPINPDLSTKAKDVSDMSVEELKQQLKNFN